MLSQKILHVIKLSRNKISETLPIFSYSTPSGTLKKDKKSRDDENQEDTAKTWKLAFDEVTKKPLLPVNPESSFFRFFQQDVSVLNPDSIKNYFMGKITQNQKESQRFIPQRHEALGNDLGSAHFLIYQGGKVKFRGIDKWMTLNKDGKSVDLPSKFDPQYILEAIDASDIVLYYEGLENINSTRIKQAIFARSPLIDDWCVDRISYLLPNLEYLDISDCPKVSERAMEALYKLPNLKTLIITNYNKSAAFELTAMMLEDCIPELKIKILEPNEMSKPKVNT